MAEVTEIWLPRKAKRSPQDQGTDMSEQEPVLRIEQSPTARGGLALIPATMNVAQAAAHRDRKGDALYVAHDAAPGVRTTRSEGGRRTAVRSSDLDAWIEAHAEPLDLEPELDVENDDHDSRRDKWVTPEIFRHHVARDA